MDYPEFDTRDMLADVKFFEGYSRYREDLGRYETWEESVDRIMDMHRRKYADVMSDRLEELMSEAREAYVNKRVLGSQRALQFGGDQILKHELKSYNCLSTYADRPEFFGETFYALLCGCGVGFSVQYHHVERLPMIRPRTKQAKTHVVEDSIEGWATALDVMMSSFLMGGGKYPEYEGRKVYFDYNEIREKGSLISGGFLAPGPDGLANAMRKIERLLVGIAEEGNLRPIDVYDVIMHVSDAVLSGGVRRSATICLFSASDDEMMTAKTGDWFQRHPQRARSNNSMVLPKDVERDVLRDAIEHIRQYGEPGIVLMESQEHATNPCAEIGMYPQIDGVSGFQGCNLTEINGSVVESPDDLVSACRAAAILGTLQAGYTDFKFLDPISKRIFEREALLGVSVTGWMNSPSTLLVPSIMRMGAATVREVNEEVAELIGIEPAARLTTVKPSGNASVLLSTTSALNGEHSRRYLRNVQLPKNQPVANLVRESNPYMVEESVWSEGRTDYCVSFPIVSPAGSILKENNTGVRLLTHVLNVQRHWIAGGTVEERCADPGLTHNVSNTIVVRDDEWDDVIDFVCKHSEDLCGLSFLSDTGDRDYDQAPFVSVPTTDEIVERYGRAALFMSGLIVDGYQGFTNPWEACDVAVRGYGNDGELADIRADWVRRFKKFADSYFDGDLRRTELCLKDVDILHRWTKIQENLNAVDISSELDRIDRSFIDIDTLGAESCAGGVCEI